MLLREEGEAVVAIGQASHAWLSGQLARAWGNEGFGPVEPWEEVCLGADQHDVGMAAWDLSPTLNPRTGRPHSFMEMPIDTHLGLWTRAPERLLTQSRYAALLVSMHGAALYRHRNLERMPADDAAAVRAYLSGQQTLQERLLGTLRADPATAGGAAPDLVARNQRLIWTWDYLSLALCLRWYPGTAEAVPTAADPVDVEVRTMDGALTLDPWPFAAPRLRVRCEGRRLEGRFDDEATMRAALDAAPWVTVEFELVDPAG
jgi:hypothetical protein